MSLLRDQPSNHDPKRESVIGKDYLTMNLQTSKHPSPQQHHNVQIINPNCTYVFIDQTPYLLSSNSQEQKATRHL